MKAMKSLFFLISIFLMISLMSCSPRKAGERSERPNIVLIISDDQSWTDFSFLGHEHIKTPRIDQLAEEGLTFTRGYTTAPLCRPALASMATGLYPHQHRIIGNDPVFEYTGDKRWGPEWLSLRSEHNEQIIAGFGQITTLADLLGEAGYMSLQTGKWWEGNYARGGFTQGMTHGNPTLGGRHGDDGLKIGREGLDVIYDFIDESREEAPFFVWYAPFLPHAPHTPPDSLMDKYLPLAPSPAVASYWAMCEWFDITCGELMDYIEEKALSENTLFIFVTDNGWIQDPDRPNRFAPRSKTEPYDMGIRTPIIYRWKGVIDPELDESSVVSSVDIAATVLGICGIQPAEQMQGINVLDREIRKGRDAIFAETYAHDFSTIDSSLYYRIIVTNPWKLILPDPLNRPGRIPELYNLDDDPFEWSNQAEAHPEIVDMLRTKLEAWWSENE